MDANKLTVDSELDKLQRETFGYFLHETNPANGLVIDKDAPDWPASIAATGLALACYPVSVERGFMSRAAATMARGFVYLIAVVDVASRKVAAHSVAITLKAVHAREVIEQAFASCGTPEIVNIDQGSQFTAEEFTDVVLAWGCKLSMDGRGAWTDNVFVERLWRRVKYERVYLMAYDGVSAARSSFAQYFDWYNTKRPHSRLDRAAPNEKYLAALPPMRQAA